MSVFELTISQRSQIIEDTTPLNPLLPAREINVKACTLSSMTHFSGVVGSWTPSPSGSHAPRALASVLAHRVIRARTCPAQCRRHSHAASIVSRNVRWRTVLCRVHSWRPLACYTFVKIKLTLCYLLLYVVYMCQKSLNFVDAFSCYKQKWKLAPINLAHPIYIPCPGKKTTIFSRYF